MPRLLRLLMAGSTLDKAKAERALSCRACWPPIERCPRALAARTPPVARAGSALFATTTGRGSCLWQLVSSDANTVLGRRATAAVERTWRLVSQDLAALARPELLDQPPRWSAQLVAREGMDGTDLVDGESLGLSAAFAQLSILSGLSTPDDVLAAAAIDEQGRVRPVDGLETKLSAVREWGLGIARVVVSTEQLDEAEQAAKANGLDVRVEGYDHLGAAIDAVFPGRLETLEGQWKSQSELATKVARTLYLQALDNRPELQSWRGFQRTARRVASCLGDAEGAVEARVAAAIANRHSNHPEALGWPEAWFAEQPLQHRVQLLAHGLQAETDGAPDTGMLDTARRQLPPPQDRAAPHHELQGAIGRALAARHRWEEAAAALRSAVDAWLQLGRAGDCSHPLSELLRVQGIRRDRDGLARSLATLDELRQAPDEEATSVAFLELAALRALAQTEQARAALQRDAEAGVHYDEMPPHVRAARLRWLLTATLSVEGTPPRTQEALLEELATLADRSPREAGFSLHLAEVELALAAGDDAGTNAALAALERAEGRDVARIRTLCGPNRLAHNCLRFWRY